MAVLCQVEPVPADYKTVPPLAKDEHINAGDTSEVTYLRTGKNCCTAVSRLRSEKNVRKTTLRTPR